MATRHLRFPHAGGACRAALWAAVPGCAIHRCPVVWRAPDDRLVTESRGRGALETRGTAATHHGLGDELAHPSPACPPPAHRVSPYGLRGVASTRGHQVWSPALIYRRRHGGFGDLGAGLDGWRRSGRSWALSSTMDVGCCLAALEPARGVAPPDIVPSEPGARWSRTDCTGRWEAAGIKSRRDGRGRALAKVVVERLWRTVQSEEVYWKDGRDAPAGDAGMRPVLCALP